MKNGHEHTDHANASAKPGATLQEIREMVVREVIKAVPDALTSPSILPRIEQLLRAITKRTRSSIPETELREIAQQEARSQIAQAGVELRSVMLDAVLPAVNAEVARQVTSLILAPQVLIRRTSRRSRTTRITGLHHHLLPQIIQLMSARTHEGFSLPLWLYGPPGAGKNVIAKQTADALGLPFYLVPLGPTSTESKIVGFRSAATGEFHPGLLHEPYRNGGVAFLDEVDVADAGVLVGANALIANESFRFPNGQVVKRHPDFHLLAGANTPGTGASGGFVRNKQDAALLSRFVKMEINYDEQLERDMCSYRGWAEYVQSVRHYVTRHVRGNVYITPRRTIFGAALLAIGWKPAEVVHTVLLQDFDRETQRRIKEAVGEFIA